ncbi:MAG: proline dehydrogenase family protein [Bacteroidota bacterium]
MNLLNRAVVAAVPFVPRALVRRFASRYIAGETVDDAIRTVRQLNADGVCTTLDVLGEDVTNATEACSCRDQSIEVLRVIARDKLDSNLSIKLTSLGLKLGLPVCIENVRAILVEAARRDIFVRFDMEDSTCTADTIAVFRALHAGFPGTGIVVQAYLHRTEADVRELAAVRTSFRLCKGIYREPPGIAFQGREEVQRNFLKLLAMMLEAGCYVGIATHDTVLVDGAREMIRRRGLSRTEYEFQMLLGVRPELRRKLVKEGHRVRLYVPFGEHWYGYSVRRFKENPEIAGYVFKALFQRNR